MTRDEMILSLGPLVYSLSCVYAAKLPKYILFDDIHSAGWIGAIKTVDKFESDRKVDIKYLAQIKINGAIKDYIRSLDSTSRSYWSKLRRESLAEESLEYDFKSKVPIKTTISLFLHSSFTDKDMLLLDAVKVSTKEDIQLSAITYLDLSDLIDESCLTEYQKRIVFLRYYEDRSLKEISTLYNCSEGKISQDFTAIIKQIRAIHELPNIGILRHSAYTGLEFKSQHLAKKRKSKEAVKTLTAAA